MVKIIVLYPPQQDADAFEKRYIDVHIPLTRKLPGLVRMDAARTKTAPGTPNPFAFMTELYFQDRDAMKNAMKSPEMAACVKDVTDNVPGGCTVYTSDDIRS